VIVLDVPKIKDRENDQQRHEDSHLTSPAAVNQLAEKLPAHAIFRSPEAHCGGRSLVEARERSPVAESPFLPALAVSSLSFFYLSSRVLEASGSLVLINRAATLGVC